MGEVFPRPTYQGSNSWIILSNRITAKSLEAKPDTHAKRRTVNVIKLFQPAELENSDFILHLSTKLSYKTENTLTLRFSDNFMTTN